MASRLSQRYLGRALHAGEGTAAAAERFPQRADRLAYHVETGTERVAEVVDQREEPIADQVDEADLEGPLERSLNHKRIGNAAPSTVGGKRGGAFAASSCNSRLQRM